MKKWLKEQEKYSLVEIHHVPIEEEESPPDSFEYILRLTIKDAHKMLKDLYRYNYDEEYPDEEEE